MFRYFMRSGFCVFRRCFCLLMAIGIALEDFQTREQVRVTHSHPYDRGADHTHPEWIGYAGVGSDDPLRSDDRDPNRHTHVFETGSEVPSTAAQIGNGFEALDLGVHRVLIPQEIRGVSREGDDFLRPPRIA